MIRYADIAKDRVHPTAQMNAYRYPTDEPFCVPEPQRYMMENTTLTKAHQSAILDQLRTSLDPKRYILIKKRNTR